MRVQKRIPWLCGLGMGLAALALSGTRAGADVSSDRPGSIVIWPKVVADGTRDTIVTLTNTSNLMAYAHCEYTEGTGHCSLTPDFCSLPTSDSCPTVPGGQANICLFDLVNGEACATRDFDVVLTRQQPTLWRASTGRFENLLSGSGTACTTIPGSPPTQSCPGEFMGGSVIPAPGQANSPADFGGFRGELRCIQTDVNGTPYGGDALKGEAIIEGVNSATNGGPLLSEYNSINVLANGQNQDGTSLELNGFQGYNACPLAVDTIHYANGAEDLVASSLGLTSPGGGADCTGGTCDVQTDFTIIPCRRDYENAVATAFNVDFEAKDDFESNFSREVAFQCWADADLTALGFTNINGATFFRTRATSTGTGLCISGTINSFCSMDSECGPGGVCAPASGILSVVEEFHPTARTTGDPSLVGSAMANTHEVDSSNIVGNLPHDGTLGRPGHCRGALGTQCVDNTDCAVGICRLTSTSCTANGNADCQTADADCLGAQNPAACCSAAGMGSCTPVPGDFCDRCMNDEITLIDGQ